MFATQPPPPIWARTPPSLGPVCLGLLGAGLAWRAAGPALGAPDGVGALWIGLALAALALCLGLYGGRAARPGALVFDLKMPPGRGAVPAFSMALMLAGAALIPLSAMAATAVWAIGVLAHGALAALLLRELLAAPPEGRPATATLLVPFAGQLVAPLAGVPLGFPGVSWALFALGIVVWLALTPAILRRLARVSVPPPMRPGAFILLAPPAIALVALERLDPGGPLLWPLFAASCLTLAGLLAHARWLTEGGWTPAWGAFTFPSAAFAAACLVMAERQLGPTWDWLAAAALTAASLVVLYVALRTGEAWAKGELAAR
ncbi:MAG: hypothetical protein ACFCUS_08515 [Rubrimonas sp.]|uniref:SLAC1 family transporter n=1 Tax=Rubrimonas sp. TaxID=2036015 RepID=UPI002FDCA6D6